MLILNIGQLVFRFWKIKRQYGLKVKWSMMSLVIVGNLLSLTWFVGVLAFGWWGQTLLAIAALPMAANICYLWWVFNGKSRMANYSRFVLITTYFKGEEQI